MALAIISARGLYLAVLHFYLRYCVFLSDFWFDYDLCSPLQLLEIAVI